MAESEPNSLVLRYLRQIDQKVDRLEVGLTSLTEQVASLVDQMLGMRGDINVLRADFVRLEHRVDDMDQRLARVEKRLELTEV